MVMESRSAIARGHGVRRRLQNLAGEVRMFCISVVVIALVYTFPKNSSDCMLKIGAFFGYVNYAFKKLIFKKREFRKGYGWISCVTCYEGQFLSTVSPLLSHFLSYSCLHDYVG